MLKLRDKLCDKKGSTMDALERVRAFLEEKAPGKPIILLEEGIHTSVLAAQALKVEVGAIAKSILFVGPTQNVLVVASGDVRIDNKKLRQIYGEKMRLGDSETVIRLTGFAPGGVCPFALASKVPILLDEKMKRFSLLYAAGGTAHSAVPVTPEELGELTGGQWALLAKE